MGSIWDAHSRAQQARSDREQDLLDSTIRQDLARKELIERERSNRANSAMAARNADRADKQFQLSQDVHNFNLQTEKDALLKAKQAEEAAWNLRNMNLPTDVVLTEAQKAENKLATQGFSDAKTAIKQLIESGYTTGDAKAPASRADLTKDQELNLQLALAKRAAKAAAPDKSFTESMADDFASSTPLGIGLSAIGDGYNYVRDAAFPEEAEARRIQNIISVNKKEAAKKPALTDDEFIKNYISKIKPTVSERQKDLDYEKLVSTLERPELLKGKKVSSADIKAAEKQFIDNYRKNNPDATPGDMRAIKNAILAKSAATAARNAEMSNFMFEEKIKNQGRLADTRLSNAGKVAVAQLKSNGVDDDDAIQKVDKATSALIKLFGKDNWEDEMSTAEKTQHINKFLKTGKLPRFE